MRFPSLAVLVLALLVTVGTGLVLVSGKAAAQEPALTVMQSPRFTITQIDGFLTGFDNTKGVLLLDTQTGKTWFWANVPGKGQADTKVGWVPVDFLPPLTR